MKRVCVRFMLILAASGILLGCAHTSNIVPTVFLPSGNKEVQSYYVNGVPIGALVTDSCSMLVSLDAVSVAGSDYLRVWLLYRNDSNQPYLLQPQEFAKIQSWREGEHWEFVPTLPSKLLDEIDNEKESQQIALAIGGALRSLGAGLSAKDTKITSDQLGGGSVTVHDREDKSQARKDIIVRETQTGIQRTANWYDAFKESVNSGILRKNTLFPGQSVNGYIYFLIPKLQEKIVINEYDIRWKEIDATDCEHLLQLLTMDGTKEIKFSPTKGE